MEILEKFADRLNWKNVIRNWSLRDLDVYAVLDRFGDRIPRLQTLGRTCGEKGERGEKDVMPWIKYIADAEHYDEVLSRVSSVKSSLWIGTADIKDLYVNAGAGQVPFLGELSRLIGRGHRDERPSSSQL